MGRSKTEREMEMKETPRRAEAVGPLLQLDGLGGWARWEFWGWGGLLSGLFSHLREYTASRAEPQRIRGP